MTLPNIVARKTTLGSLTILSPPGFFSAQGDGFAFRGTPRRPAEALHRAEPPLSICTLIAPPLLINTSLQ